jgi:hypothetical protein
MYSATREFEISFPHLTDKTAVSKVETAVFAKSFPQYDGKDVSKCQKTIISLMHER